MFSFIRSMESEELCPTPNLTHEEVGNSYFLSSQWSFFYIFFPEYYITFIGCSSHLKIDNWVFSNERVKYFLKFDCINTVQSLILTLPEKH